MKRTERTPEEVFDLDALRAGDRAESARLLHTYTDRIYRVALKILRNPQDAEDVLQETFIKAFRNLPNFDGRSSLATWLYRIATNEALMILRKHKRLGPSLDEPQDTLEEAGEPQEVSDWCCLPEDELMSAEARQVIDAAIEALPESLRTVFVLRDLEGMSTAETGELLNLTETAVKTRLSRARLRLRESLAAYYGERLRQKQQAN
jgi:RNA polymerase sigma-70 factor (ECF subfamily)